MGVTNRQQTARTAALVVLVWNYGVVAGFCKPPAGVTDKGSGIEIPSEGTGNQVPGSKGGVDTSHPYGYHLEPILQKIKASPDQRTKIVTMVQSYKVKIQPLREEYKLKRQDLIVAMTSGGAAESIMAKGVELSHLKSEITVKYTLMRIEMRRLLTPEQILKYEEYARQHGWNQNQPAQSTPH